jgi:hypothetical protein
MKKLLFSLISMLLLINLVFSQNGISVNTTGGPADNSAILDISSTSQGLLIPRLTTVQRDNIASPAISLLIFNTTTNCFEAYVNGQWYSLSCPPPPSFTCGDKLLVTHTAGVNGVPVNKTINYGTVLTNIAGTGNKCWITQNLGATKQAASATDPSDGAAGWYWQFDNKQGWDYNAGIYAPPLSSWNSSAYGSDVTWISANDPCNLLLGAGWRIPTCTEWTNADANGGWNNYNDTYNSVLKIHAAGYLDHLSNGALVLRGILGNYWGNEQNASFTACNLQSLSYDSEVGHSEKPYGFSLRCLRD